ncbi:hypothetical protein HGRIS_014532 [Hohenbuehelia grisea]|uniref:ABC transmembrane type-1 domain-containing protein n=1 Tax=Hohenbuehelia grisea TaxID=104357 RepID=A0ABR3JVY2_9AGAR
MWTTKLVIDADALIIPSAAAALSVAILIVHFLCSILGTPPSSVSTTGPESHPRREEDDQGCVAHSKSYVSIHGGITVIMVKLTRLLGCILLLGTSVASLRIERSETEDKSNPFFVQALPGDVSSLTKTRNWWQEFGRKGGLHISISITYLYACLLCIFGLVVKPLPFAHTRASRLGGTAWSHFNGILLVTFFVYTYRDLYPLATYTSTPRDLPNTGASISLLTNLLWTHITILGITAVVLPLLQPRVYAPVDTDNPAMEPNPEQTASILSLALFTFLDPLVLRAWRMPHLPYELLPPLADYDRAAYLRKRSSPYLDPVSPSSTTKRHIFVGLMRTFWLEYLFASVLLVLNVVAGFASPVAVNRLLNFIEKSGQNATMRPWVWISWLFFGPFLASVTIQWYEYITSGINLRIESLLTELLFEHALRIRMRSTEGSSSLDTNSKPGTSGDNLQGKINNLVTTDMANILEARDFLFIVIQIPCQIALSIAFLYVVLNWSALVGLAVMVVLFPVPGKFAQWMQKVQQELMKRNDARVQSVTETINVLRMVKLFGWEQKMNERISEKREAELVFVWKSQVLKVTSSIINYSIPVLTMLATYATYVSSKLDLDSVH